jgi:hypothetical protein
MVLLPGPKRIAEREGREQERDEPERGGERDEGRRRLGSAQEQGQRPP